MLCNICKREHNRKSAFCSKLCYTKSRIKEQIICEKCNKISNKHYKYICAPCYREQNMDVIKLRRELYHQNNKQEISDYNKHFYQANKNRIINNIKEYKKTPEGNFIRKLSIILRKYKKKDIHHNFTLQEWHHKKELTQGICPICHKNIGINNLTMDHNPPISKVEKGFIYTINNVYPLCLSCNCSKSAKIMDINFEEFIKSINGGVYNVT